MSPPPVGNYTLLKTIPDDHTLSVLVESSPLVVVHFGAEWCAPCKAMNDAMENIIDERHRRVVVVVRAEEKSIASL